jgi:hypothetical protein
VFRGKAIVNSRASPAVRVERALLVKRGQADLVDLTVRQIAFCFGVSARALGEAAKNGSGDRDHRQSDAVEAFQRKWERLNHEERVAWARRAGTEIIFDVVAAALDEIAGQPESEPEAAD